ncbi:MAG: class I SAM-dependent methyltransferase [Anaerolineales bacterium]
MLTFLPHIPLDFDTQGLETAFGGTAFDPAKPAVFVWEGVTQYLVVFAGERIVHARDV